MSIEEVYKNFGRGGYLTIVYADKHLGMQGLMTMEKWMIRLLILIACAWVAIYGYSYYVSWFEDSSSSGTNAGTN